jgi:hypothetical protein
MHTTILATFLEISRTAVSMCSAGILLFLVALWAARTDIPRAGGLDKIVVLCNLCFAIPLAVFGAEHLSGAQFIMLAVPSYMPWRLFWAYFVGFALLSASLSIATKIQVRWVRLAVRDHDVSFCGDGMFSPVDFRIARYATTVPNRSFLEADFWPQKPRPGGF